MEMAFKGSFGDLVNTKFYFVMKFSYSDPWGFLASLTSRLTVCGAKINMDPLPGKSVTFSDASSFLGIA